MAVAPITPEEAGSASMPDFVITAINGLLSQRARGGKATITQDEAIEAIIATSPHPIDKASIFDQNLLDFENVYRAAGWKVEYDKPAYCENYPARFNFRKA